MNSSFKRQLTNGDLLVARSARPSTGTPRARNQDARAAAGAELGARAAVYGLLGDGGRRSSWRGRADGTAIGVVDGMRFRWTPSPDHLGQLMLIRACYFCDVTWVAPVRSEGQLLGAVVEDRCGCVRRAVSS